MVSVNLLMFVHEKTLHIFRIPQLMIHFCVVGIFFRIFPGSLHIELKREVNAKLSAYRAFDRRSLRHKL